MINVVLWMFLLYNIAKVIVGLNTYNCSVGAALNHVVLQGNCGNGEVEFTMLRARLRITLLIVALIVLCMSETTAYAADYSLISNRIVIYNQNAYAGTKFSISNLDLSKAGCGFFSVAHALQYMGISSWNGLDDFVEKTRECTSPSEWGSRFIEQVESIYGGFSYDQYFPTSDSEAFYQKLDSTFKAGGCGTVVISSSLGHYILFTSFSSDRSKIHVLDSSAGTTLNHLASLNRNAYYYDATSKSFKVVTNITQVPGTYNKDKNPTDNYGIGREYWVDRDYIYAQCRQWGGGLLIMMPDVPLENPDDDTYLFSEKSIYKATKATSVKTQPYAKSEEHPDSETLITLAKGDEVTVVEAYRNSYKNQWYKISAVNGDTSYNGYVYSGDFTYVRSNAEAYIENNSMYNANIKAGNGYEITGRLRSTNAITKIDAYVYMVDMVGPPYPVKTVSFSSDTYTFDLGPSVINTGIKLANYTTTGNYIFRLDVHCKTNGGSDEITIPIYTPFVISSSGSGSSVNYLDPIVFNLDYYLEANPDVKAMNWSADVVQNHWLQNGISEGRAASPAFDVAYYVNQNADLQGYSGNYAGAIEHYCTNGVYESRPTSSLFNIAQYKENYPDLAESLSDDDYEITYHYVGAGYKEGRIANRPLMVYFDGNGGSVTTGSKAIQKSRKYGILPTPTRSGFSFDGWYTAASGGTRVTEDTIHDSIHELTLYAHWSKRMVTDIALSPTAISLNVGDAQTLSVSVVPSDAYDRSVTWSTTNSAVATVSSGRITAVGAGMATIICTANDGSGVTARCTVTVSDSHTHTLVMIAPIPASSTENGRSIGLRCSDCNEIMLQQTVIDAGWVLALPKGLQCVEEEAFTGADMEQINVPEGMTEIKARAFADCKSLMLVTIPDSVTTIAESAFSGCNETYFCIVADAGSAAAKYAKNHGYQLWSPGTSYTVHFDLNGASGSIADIVVENGAPLGTLPTAVRDYFRFDGWYTEPVYGSRVSAETIYDNRTETLTLYARWTENAYSDWVTEDSVPAGARIVDTKTQYRYRDTTYSTVYSSWSAWGDWTTTRETTSDLKKEEAATVYGWYWFQCPNCGAHWHVWSGLAIDCSPTWGPGGGCGNDNIQSTDGHIVWNTTPWSSGTSNWCGTGKICLGSDIKTRMFAWTDGGSAREGYRYATRTSSQQASVGAWSSWSDTAVSSSSTREVETRRLVRYQAK